MHPPLPLPRRFRRRLVVAFVLVAGVLTSALAIGTYVLVRESRLSDSLQRAERETRFGLALASNLTAGSDLQQFVDAYEPLGVHAILLVDGRRYASDPSVAPPIPADIRALVAKGDLAYRRITIAGDPYLVLGGRPPGSNAELYLLFSESGLRGDLAQLRRVLQGGWLAAIAVGSLAGWAVARRTLAPVAEASRAARALAEGLLDTRLPVQTEDEFGAWAASFNEMAYALESKIEELSEAEARERRFTSDVAHELRTPLTALVGEASILLEHLDQIPPEARRPAEMLVADVSRLRRLVEDLLEISRIDAGQGEVRPERVELGALVAAVVRSRGWDDRVALETQEVVVQTDRRRVERIVSNLVGNAVGHGGRGVRVRLGAEGERALIEVSDRGPGIAPEQLPHVFERFYKADPARSGSGSGLGLSIALENARLLGGEIEVRSEPGVGTTFRLLLPVVTQRLLKRDGLVAPEVEDEDGAEDEGGDPR